jgi:hypothetical protein
MYVWSLRGCARGQATQTGEKPGGAKAANKKRVTRSRQDGWMVHKLEKVKLRKKIRRLAGDDDVHMIERLVARGEGPRTNPRRDGQAPEQEKEKKKKKKNEAASDNSAGAFPRFDAAVAGITG